MPRMLRLQKSLAELIVQTSTQLPPDVRRAMAAALAAEAPESRSGKAMAIIDSNIDMAADCEGPICQDTGWPTFEVKTPVGVSQIEVEKARSELIGRRAYIG